MPTSIPMHPSQYNSYHFQDSLLFQFILREMVETTKILEILKLQLEKQKHRNSLAKIAESLGRLVGNAHEFTRLISWKPDHSPMTKLKNYCALFLNQVTAIDKVSQQLHRHSDQAWMDFTRAQTQLREEGEIPELFIEKGFLHFDRLRNTVKKLFLEFRDDENVLFFIMRHRDALDAVFGNHFVHKTLLKLFTKGILEAKHFLITKYTQRGFHELIPEIEVYFSRC